MREGGGTMLKKGLRWLSTNWLGRLTLLTALVILALAGSSLWARRAQQAEEARRVQAAQAEAARRVEAQQAQQAEEARRVEALVRQAREVNDKAQELLDRYQPTIAERCALGLAPGSAACARVQRCQYDWRNYDACVRAAEASER